MPSILLALDTAFERCSVGVYDRDGGDRDGGRLLAARSPEIGKGHAEQLIPLTGEALAEAGIAYADIAKIAVTVGPGSFTGLRVGLAAARGLSFALGVPAVGVSTLEAMAAPFFDVDHEQAGPILSVLDARRGEIYAALYGSDGGVLAAPAVLAPGDLPAFVDNLLPDGAALRLTGSGAAIAAERLTRLSPQTILGEAVVDIEALAMLAADRAPDGPVRPLYLRGADAKMPSKVGLTFA